MVTAVVFPSTLPGPSVAAVTPAERRLLSDLPGPQQVRGLQRDYLATQQLEWSLLDATAAAAWQSWWKDTLVYGGRWFAATWPLPAGWQSAVRRLIGTPRWQHLPGGFWKVTAAAELRGRGLPPNTWPPFSLAVTDSFRYLTIAVDDATDYSGRTFDDSAWSIGNGPFGDQVHTVNNTGFPSTPGTIVSGTAVWLRARGRLTSAALPISVQIKYDNIPSFYLDGVLQTIPQVAPFLGVATLYASRPDTLIAMRVINTPPTNTAGNPLYAGIIASQAS